MNEARSMLGCSVLSFVTQTETRHVMLTEGYHHWKRILLSDSASKLLWRRQGDRHNKSACVQRKNFKQHSSDSACNWWQICVNRAARGLGGR